MKCVVLGTRRRVSKTRLQRAVARATRAREDDQPRALTWPERGTESHPQPAAALRTAANGACETLHLRLGKALFVTFAHEETVHLGGPGARAAGSRSTSSGVLAIGSKWWDHEVSIGVPEGQEVWDCLSHGRPARRP